MYDLTQAGSKKAKIINPLNDNLAEVSYFDVKELYEAAYAAKASNEGHNTFCILFARAEKLDTAYRAQLAAQNNMRYFKAA